MTRELQLPKRKPGRQSAEAEANYQAQVTEFCALIKQIASTLDFKVGSRGFCYLLEPHGLRKGDFDKAQLAITHCRKSGDLPLDICAEDESRSTIGVEDLDNPDVKAEAQRKIDYLRNHAHEYYTPISFWNDLDTYVEVAVEKLDLRSLFEQMCTEFCVPVTNFKGWSDLHSRAAMMQRFRDHEAAGRKCVFLVCGDHDPGGLQITGFLPKNLADLSGAVGWSPDNLLITRFGLNADFIDEHNLTWIDNLITSKDNDLADPRNKEHHAVYVQDYIRRFGVGKCEANALVVAPEIGRRLCRDAILEHVPADAPRNYQRRLERERKKLQRELRARIVK